MIIKTIRLKNIRSYIDETIEFPPGSVMLSGEIGSGKSSILMAILFALFAPIKSEIDGSALLRHGATSGFIELTVEIGGKEMVIRRDLKRTKDSIQQSGGAIIIDGVQSDLAAKQIKARMLEALGYPIELLEKHFIDIFQFTVYTPQERIKQIITTDPDSRKQSLNAVFDIDRYKTVGDGAAQTVTEINHMIKQLVRDAKGLEEDRETLNEAEESLKKGETALVKTKKEIKVLQEQKQQADSEYATIQDELKELAGLEGTFTVTQKLKEEYEQKNQKSMKKLGDFKKEQQDYEGRLEDKKNKLKPIEEKGIDLKKTLETLESRIKEVSKEQGGVNQRITDLEQILAEGICATCEQEVQDKSKFQGKIDSKKAYHTDLLREKAEVEGKIKEKKDLLEKISDNKVLQAEITNLTTNLERVKQDQIAKTKQIQETEGKLKEVNQNLVQVQEKIIAKGKFKELHAPLKQRLEEIQGNLNILTAQKAELEEKIRGFQKDIKEKNKAIQAKEKATRHTNHLQEVGQWLKEHLPKLLTEMEAQATAKILFDFNTIFQKWFGILMQDSSIDVRLDEGFRPVIIQNGYETDFNTNLSGGEGTSVSLAYRLALNQVINNQKEDIKTKDLLILDEPTYGFSRAQLKRVRDVFNMLNTRQLIIVSHEPEVESFVNCVIHIEKRNDISRIIKVVKKQ